MPAMVERRYKEVAVLMGGISSEREISLRSGRAIATALQQAGYTVHGVDLQTDTPEIPAGVQAVFIALHGRFGEDGGVQERLELMGVPYTGSGIDSSRVSFDKVLTRSCLIRHGIPVPEGDVLHCGRPSVSAGHIADALVERFGLPLVVKPPREGSSIGVHIVREAASLEAALEDAFEYSDDVLIEQFVPGRELTVGLLDDRVLPPVEIRAAGGVYDFDAKYVTGATEYCVPAELPESVALSAQRIARQTFDALGCAGLGRVDFRLAPDGKLFVLELNSIPGFTESSLLPKAAAAAGIGFVELCEMIMENASLKGLK